MDYKFYSTYIGLIDQDFSFRKDRELTEFEKKLRHGKFRKYLLDTYGVNFHTIMEMEDIMRSGMLRPQRLITDTPNFYIACDMITNTYYVCYRNLMMIDIDFYKEVKETEVKETEVQVPEDQVTASKKLFLDDVKENPDHCWTLYRSKGGVHAFLNSKSMNYHTKETCELMLKFKADFNYVVYSYIRGWCVRLNKKQKETHVIAEYLDKIGNESKELPELTKLIALHLNLIDVFKNEDPCNMYGV
jgi:hypothetical protein